MQILRWAALSGTLGPVYFKVYLEVNSVVSDWQKDIHIAIILTWYINSFPPSYLDQVNSMADRPRECI